MSLEIEYDGSRQLRVRENDGDTYLLLASSHSEYLNKPSKTWNYITNAGKRVRIQIQEFEQ